MFNSAKCPMFMYLIVAFTLTAAGDIFVSKLAELAKRVARLHVYYCLKVSGNTFQGSTSASFISTPF